MDKGYKYYQKGAQEDKIYQKIDVEKTIGKFFASAYSIDIDRSDYLSQIAAIDNKRKRAMRKSIRRAFPECCESEYRGCISDFRKFEFDCPTTSNSFLAQNNTTKFQFNVTVSDDYLYLHNQFLVFESDVPELNIAESNALVEDDLTDPDVLSQKVRFVYTDKPGIRLFPEYSFYCDSTEIEQKRSEEINLCDHQYIPYNLRDLWNDMIGIDNGVEANLNSISTNSTIVEKIKYGYQTLKAQQEGLSVKVPLAFNHTLSCGSMLNTGLINKDTLSVQGELQSSTNMVAAYYYPDAVGEENPIRLVCKPLGIKSFRLYNEYVKKSDIMHALELGVSWSRILGLVRAEKYDVTDLDNEIKLRGQGSDEITTVAIRPKEYEDSFSLWHQFSEVEKKCTQEVVVAAGDAPDFLLNQMSIGVASANVPVPVFSELGLSQDGEDLKKQHPTFVYDDFSKFKLTRNSSGFVPRSNDGTYILIHNEYFLTKQISMLLNRSYLHNSTLTFDVKDEYKNEDRELICKYQLLVYHHMINNTDSYGKSFGIRYLY